MMERSSNNNSFLAKPPEKTLLIATPLLHISLVTSILLEIPTYLFNFFVATLDEKIIMIILTSLQYKPLSNINRSEKWVK